MRGFYWGTGAVRCGFCAHKGHNITTCKLVDFHARAALQKIQHNPTYMCNKLEHKALTEIKRREERSVKIRKPRKPSTCSFCNNHLHKRPNCKYLKDFKQLVYKANKNWKRIFVERVNEVGLGIGALVKFDENTVYSLDFNVDPHLIAMITKYDLNNMNFFCALAEYSEYQSEATMEILSGERSDYISVKYLSSILGDDLLHRGWWYSQSSPEVISPMSWNPDKSWLESEWDEKFDWLFKRINKQATKSQQVVKFIEKWAEK